MDKDLGKAETKEHTATMQSKDLEFYLVLICTLPRGLSRPSDHLDHFWNFL